MVSITNDIIHLADFSFIQFCIRKYGVNRGVYNTIDLWFYKNGLVDILVRRRNILIFLESLTELKNPRLKFGSGGLTMKLQQYCYTAVMKNASSYEGNI